jgi:hypothetical protein
MRGRLVLGRFCPRLDLRQGLRERRLRKFRVVVGLQPQPPAIRESEETAQPQIGVRRHGAHAGEDLANALRARFSSTRRSRALEQADGSSSAIGTAVNHAIEACAKIIVEALADERTYDLWLDRLWEAHQNDGVHYIERPEGPFAPAVDAGAMVSEGRLIGVKYSTGHGTIDGNRRPRTISRPLRD